MLKRKFTHVCIYLLGAFLALPFGAYSQEDDWTPVENLLMTYDREVVKFDFEHLREIHETLIEN